MGGPDGPLARWAEVTRCNIPRGVAKLREVGIECFELLLLGPHLLLKVSTDVLNFLIPLIAILEPREADWRK